MSGNATTMQAAQHASLNLNKSSSLCVCVSVWPCVSIARYVCVCVCARARMRVVAGADSIQGLICNTACRLTQHTLYNWTQRSKDIRPQAVDYADIWHILLP